MKLTVLVDNNTLIDQYYLGEPGVCYYIEDDETKLLFDTGYSDIFMQNANALGIDLTAISSIVISHGHNDHSRGLMFLYDDARFNDINLIAHPDAFSAKCYEGDMIGSPLSKRHLGEKFCLALTREPVNVSENIVFLGEIPELNDFENRRALGSIVEDETDCDDLVLDDSALVYRGRDGLFIITGCSHSGICNIVEYAKQVCNEQRIAGIIGGFHLKNVSERLTKTIGYFQQNNVAALYPCHCVSFAAKAEINRYLPVNEVGVGMTLNID